MGENTAKNTLICFVIMIVAITVFNDLKAVCQMAHDTVSITILVYVIMISGICLVYGLICLIVERVEDLTEAIKEYLNKKVEIKIKIKGGKNE